NCVGALSVGKSNWLQPDSGCIDDGVADSAIVGSVRRHLNPHAQKIPGFPQPIRRNYATGSGVEQPHSIVGDAYVAGANHSLKVSWRVPIFCVVLNRCVAKCENKTSRVHRPLVLAKTP